MGNLITKFRERKLVNTLTNREDLNAQTPLFSLKGTNTYAKIVKIYDGDTIQAIFEFPAGVFKRWKIRLSGIDTPELKTKNEKEKELALLAKEYVKEKILDKIVYLEIDDFEKYGRLLAVVQIPEEGRLFNKNRFTNLNQDLIKHGHAKVYEGGTKEKW